MGLLNVASKMVSGLLSCKFSKITLLKIYLVNLLLLLSANAAYAGPLDGIAIDVPDTDLSIQYLKSIFGTFGPLDGPEEKTVLGAIMMIWNASALLIGAIIVGYTVFAGVLKTAHEGEFLGRQWSSIWVPFRSSIAMSMILPLATGYSLIQGAGMWAVTQGVGIANMVNEKALVYIDQNGGAVTTPQPANGMNMVANLYKQLVCVESLNPILQAENATRGPGEPQLVIQRYPTQHPITGSRGYTYGFEGNEAACGGMSWSVSDQAVAELQQITANGVTIGNLLSNLGNLNGVQDNVMIAQMSSIDAVSADMQIAIRNSLDPNIGTTPSYDQFRGWVKTYNSLMAAEVAKTMQPLINSQGNLDVVSQAINKDGWASTGSYFVKITHINDIIHNLVDSQASDISMDINLPEDYLKQVADNLEKANTYIHEMVKTSQTGLKAAYNAQTGLTSEVDDLKEVQSSLSVAFTTADPEFFEMDNIKPYISNLFQSVGAGVISLLQKDENPITRIQNLGNLVLGVKGTLDVIEYAPIATNAASKLLSKAGDAASAVTETSKNTGALAKITGLLGSSSSLLFVAGIVMAVVIPMIPYIIWTLGVLSWLTSVLIAMVATPLWAISHATPGGDDAMGQGSNGYVLLMSITLRPVLMLFGFYAAMLILFAIDKLLTQSFITSFITMNSNSMNGPYVMTAAVLMYGVMSLVLVTGSFKLIYTIPNAILSWVGGRDDDVTDVGGNLNENRSVIYAASNNMKSVGHMAKGATTKVVTKGLV